jgi:hypothetical protein
MHAAVLRRRREWFERFEAPTVAMWWVPAGRLPTVAEAKWRLELLEAHGDTARAFTFKRPFPAGEETGSESPAAVWRPCGAT